MTKTAAIYCRISKDRVGARLGVDRQEADCRELAARQGWAVSRVYTDNDLSAYSGKPRPGYRDLLVDVAAGRIGTVVAWHTDRLHRSPVELEEYIGVCEPKGVPTHTVKAGPLDLATPSGRMVARQLGAVARYEVEHMIERQQSAKAQAAASGKWKGGRRPYGWESDGVTVRPGEAKIVEEMARHLLAGGSIRGIAVDLNRRGVTTSTGTKWTDTAVRRVLARPRNAGLMEHRGEILEGVETEWRPILAVETWRAVRHILADPERKSTPGPTRRWLLSGLARCGVCGGPCIATRVGNHTGQAHGLVTAYTCRESRHVVRNAMLVDQLVSAVVVERLSRPDALDLLQTGTTVDIGVLNVEVTVTRERLDGLATAYADGTIDARQLDKGTAKLRTRMAELTTAIADASRGSVLAGVVDAEDVQVTWAALDLDRRRAIIDTLLTLRVLRAPKGRRAGWSPGETYFDPTTVEITWRT